MFQAPSLGREDRNKSLTLNGGYSSPSVSVEYLEQVVTLVLELINMISLPPLGY